MPRPGSYSSLMDELHAQGCNGKEFTKMTAVPTTPPDFVVIWMCWCGECGAADYEVL